MAGPRLTDKHKHDRLNFYRGTLSRLKNGDLDSKTIVFTDETTIRGSATKIVTRNARAWVDKNALKKKVPVNLITKPKSNFSVWVMAHLSVTKLGKLTRVFCAEQLKVSASSYLEMLNLQIIPQEKKLAGDKPVVWQQDNAASHAAKKVYWTASSPDLSPLDYSVNGYLVRNVRAKVGGKASSDTIRSTILEVFEEIGQAYNGRTIEDFPKRLQKCLRVDFRRTRTNTYFFFG